MSLSPVSSEHLTDDSKASIAEDSARFIYRRAWAFRMGVVGLAGLALSSVAVIKLLVERKADGLWDAVAISIIPLAWLTVALIPGIVWATNAKAVDIARLASAVRGGTVTE